AGVPVHGGVAGGDLVVAQAQVLLEAALAHPVDVHAEGQAAAPGAVQVFGADAGEHALQQAAVDAVVVVARELADVGQLQVGHRHPGGGDVFALVGAHARQVAGRGVGELVEVVDQAHVD